MGSLWQYLGFSTFMGVAKRGRMNFFDVKIIASCADTRWASLGNMRLDSA